LRQEYKFWQSNSERFTPAGNKCSSNENIEPAESEDDDEAELAEDLEIDFS